VRGWKIILSPHVVNQERKIMKYIKVTNSANNVNRLKLEKLGFSTKRDDVNTIGQFGSGIKFAPIAAARKGIEFIFVGQDDKGPYTLEYVIREEEDISSIFYKYEDYEKPSSFTAEAGILSWESDFQIYREVIANAIDEAKISGTEWNAEIVDVEKIIPVEGEFSVYLSATESLSHIHDNFDKYFSVNRNPIFIDSSGNKIYEPIDPNVFRVYSKGVLVFSADNTFKSYAREQSLPGFFDYELDYNLELNEERTVSNTFQMNNSVVSLLSKAMDSNIMKAVLDNLINSSSLNNYYENQHISEYSWSSYSYLQDKDQFFDNFIEVFPEGILLSAKEANVNIIESTRVRGYNPIVIQHDGIFSFLKNIGAPTYNSILGEYFKYDVTKDLSLYPTIVSSMAIINDIYPEFVEENDGIGVYFGDDERILAVTTNIPFENETEYTKKILVNHSFADVANIPQMISTLVHEWDHKKSGIGDGDSMGREFRSLADEKIGYLIYELWKAKKKK